MKVMTETKHTSVLLKEVVEGLSLRPGMIVVDATLGGGGHTRALLEQVLPGGKVIAIDADTQALERFEIRAQSDEFLKQALVDKSLVLVHSNYSELGRALEDAGSEHVDAILADLGFSSDQIEDAERGFSFQKNGPLDMRLDQSTDLTAEKIVNTFSQSEIADLLQKYGEESEARHIAEAIVTERERKPFQMTHDLTELIERVYPKGKRYRMKIHPATKTFQALRIAVNQEGEHLATFLSQAVEYLKTGSRLVVITFHSGEDRIVKQFFRDASQGCICPPNFPVCRCDQTPNITLITRKPIIPSEQEREGNPRARSAKLRIIEKL